MSRGADGGMVVSMEPGLRSQLLRIDVGSGSSGLISASRGHPLHCYHLLPKAARGSVVQHQTHFSY